LVILKGDFMTRRVSTFIYGVGIVNLSENRGNWLPLVYWGCTLAQSAWWHREIIVKLTIPQSLIVTDKLKSYGPAKAAVLPSVEHRQQKHQNIGPRISH